jgi:hypothetical protein
LKYSSTDLPQTNDPQQIQKAQLDMLQKVNDTHDAASSAQSTADGKTTVAPIKDADRSATLIVNTSTNTAGVWSASVTMPLPDYAKGAMAVWCMCVIYVAAGTPTLCVEAASGYALSDITAGNNRFKYHGYRSPVNNFDQNVILKIHLDANGQFKWCTTTNNCTVLIGSPIDYEKNG